MPVRSPLPGLSRWTRRGSAVDSPWTRRGPSAGLVVLLEQREAQWGFAGGPTLPSPPSARVDWLPFADRSLFAAWGQRMTNSQTDTNLTGAEPTPPGIPDIGLRPIRPGTVDPGGKKGADFAAGRPTPGVWRQPDPCFTGEGRAGQLHEVVDLVEAFVCPARVLTAGVRRRERRRRGLASTGRSEACGPRRAPPASPESGTRTAVDGQVRVLSSPASADEPRDTSDGSGASTLEPPSRRI
jgi:hypothetical protein